MKVHYRVANDAYSKFASKSIIESGKLTAHPGLGRVPTELQILRQIPTI